MLDETPEKRMTVVGIVRSYMRKYYDEGRWDELNFDEVNAAVRASFPNSRFNPYHLAHYKHKFLLKLDDVKLNYKIKGRVT